MTSSKNRELRRLELQYDRACDSRFLARSLPHLLGEPAYSGVRFIQQDIGFERVFGGHRPRWPVGFDRIVVVLLVPIRGDASRSVRIDSGGSARSRFSNVSDCPHSDFCEPPRRHLTNSRQSFHRKRRKKSYRRIRLDDEQAIRLSPVGSDLREELVRCDPSRSSQIQFLSNLLPNRARATRRTWK